MSDHDALVERLARLVGIADASSDAFGHLTPTPMETRRAILAGFGLPAATAAEAAESLHRLETLQDGPLPQVMTAVADQAAAVPLRGAAATPDGTAALAWRLVNEQGEVQEGRCAPVHHDGRPALPLPALAPGYYELHLDSPAGPATATVIAAPSACFTPSDLDGGARRWGAAAQAYGLRSPRNFGIGDFTDVAETARGAGHLGASFLGLSPLHALFAGDRTKISPYSPSSRLFLEPLFIDPARIPGFAGSEAARSLDGAEVAARLEALRAAPLVDHAAVWSLKAPLLESLWAHFQMHGEQVHGDRQAFDAFQAAQGEPLACHATFEALFAAMRAKGRAWAGEWPAAFRDARSAEVRAFRESHAERIAFHAWLQWEADRQLAEAHGGARAAGMGIGLYRDLAVGADRGGSEVWSAPEHFGRDLSVGAPPDPIAPNGQDWGLPPVDPLALERTGLAAFRALVRANMRHAGAIRIDHAFQLRRLFLIPQGAPATEGTYVTYPFEAMLAVLRLESHRARALVIAEDLGNAPEGFSDAIMQAGLYSYRVLPFEREHGGCFRKPRDYPRRALAVMTTHDLPTFAGWYRGRDIDLRQSFGIFTAEEADAARRERTHDIDCLARALADEDLLPSPVVPMEPPFDAATRYLARSASALMGMQLEDALHEVEQANLPGLVEGHPNWRRRLGADTGTLVAPDGPLARMAALAACEGRGSGAGHVADRPPAGDGDLAQSFPTMPTGAVRGGHS